MATIHTFPGPMSSALTWYENTEVPKGAQFPIPHRVVLPARAGPKYTLCGDYTFHVPNAHISPLRRMDPIHDEGALLIRHFSEREDAEGYALAIEDMQRADLFPQADSRVVTTEYGYYVLVHHHKGPVVTNCVIVLAGEIYLEPPNIGDQYWALFSDGSAESGLMNVFRSPE